jgi:hypothetical protein
MNPSPCVLFTSSCQISERDDIANAIEFLRRGSWDIILRTGAGTAFNRFAHVADDFRSVANARISEPRQCVGSGGAPNWVYLVDNSDDGQACRTASGAWQTPSCSVVYNVERNHGNPCATFNIVSRDANDYRAYYDDTAMSEFRITDHHKWLIYGDMLIDGYAPLMRTLDIWWRMVRSDLRPHNSADEDLYRYVFGTSPYPGAYIQTGSWGRPKRLAGELHSSLAICMGYRPNAQELDVAMGYGFDQGPGALNEICEAGRGDGLAPWPLPPEVRPPLSEVIDRMRDGGGFETFH